MIPAEAIHAADELRALLRDGILPQLGFVDVGQGARLTFESAVRVTLADLTRFTAWEEAGRAVEVERWYQLGEDLMRLHRMAITARGPGVGA
jgi:hypothetical protein